MQEMDVTFVIYTESKFIERNSGDVIELLQTHSTKLRKMGKTEEGDVSETAVEITP